MLYVVEVETFSVQGGRWVAARDTITCHSRKELKEQVAHMVGTLTASAGTDLCKNGEGQLRAWLAIMPLWDESQLRAGLARGIDVTKASLGLDGPDTKEAEQIIEEAFKEAERNEAERN